MPKKKAPGPPRRRKGWKNTDVRPREHLSEDEVRRLRSAAGRLGRNRHRDATMLLLAYRHGLRVNELVRLRWDRVQIATEEVMIYRSKGSDNGMHTLEADEIKALEKLPGERIGWIFKSETGGRMSESSVRKIVARAGEAAGFEYPIHPHMLRHACGYMMHKNGRDIRDIQVWLGHRSINNTTQYTKLDADRFKKVRMW